MLESGDWSDFEIKCGSRTWKVHKFVICHQSGFFRKVCKASGFKVVQEFTLGFLETIVDVNFRKTKRMRFFWKKRMSRKSRR